MASAFNARFRITENKKRTNERSPERNIAVDFTTDQAIAAANWLMTMAENADRDGNTVRVYAGKNDFEERPGFTLWGGLWGETGSFSPMAIEAGEAPF